MLRNMFDVVCKSVVSNECDSHVILIVLDFLVHKHSDCIHNTCRDTPIMLNASGDISIMCMCLACSTQQRSLLYCYCIQLAHGDICCFWKSSLARLLTSPVCYVYTGTPLTPFSY